MGSLQESLTSLREGLQECEALLAPTEPGPTLVLSSLRSESVKGFVTRTGTKVVKGVGYHFFNPYTTNISHLNRVLFFSSDRCHVLAVLANSLAVLS